MPKSKESKKSSRWETTTSGQLAQTADPVVRAEIKAIKQEFKEKAEEKKNSGNAMSFGNEKVEYVTNSMAQMGRSVTSLDTKEIEENKKKIRDLKALLGTATIELGDQTPTCYESTARAASKQSSQPGTKTGETKVLEAKVSKIYFGPDKPEYVSEYTRLTSAVGEPNEFKKTKQDAKKLKDTLSKRNFDLGNETNLDYTSDSRRNLVAHSPDEYRKNLMRSETKAYLEDTRKCHFSLGQDRVDYKTNTQLALTGGSSASEGERMEHMQNVRDMKTKLTKTSFQLGDDDDDEDA